MIGAREYAKLFKESQQIGKLYLEVGRHARGRTFKIWVLPSNEKITEPVHTIEDAVKVYGMIRGQRGWTEEYGWLHKGKWVQDFERLVDQQRKILEEEQMQRGISQKRIEETKEQKIQNILNAY